MKSTYDWAHRIMVEASAHEHNCVVTLTYDDEHLPVDGLLNYRDVQLFHKRLRKLISPQKLRFFVSCEYGDKKGRPHYHDIIFGWSPPDLKYMFQRHGNRFSRSEILNDVWGQGFATVGTLTEKSALYAAKYLQKLNFSDKEVPPSVRMSLRPGIGACGYSPTMLQSRKLYLSGKAYNLPRFYLKRLQCDFPEYFGDDYKFVVHARMRHVMDGVSSVDMLRRLECDKNFKKKFRLKS